MKNFKDKFNSNIVDSEVEKFIRYIYGKFINENFF